MRSGTERACLDRIAVDSAAEMQRPLCEDAHADLELDGFVTLIVEFDSSVPRYDSQALVNQKTDILGQVQKTKRYLRGDARAPLRHHHGTVSFDVFLCSG
jgi:hypothetical protein